MPGENVQDTLKRGVVSPRWPDWSLPPPEKNLIKDTAQVKSDNNEKHGPALEEAMGSRIFSLEESSQENSRISSGPHLLSPADVSCSPVVVGPEMQNVASQCKQASAPAEILVLDEEEQGHSTSCSCTDSSQYSDGLRTPSRPITPEAANCPLLLVTGHHNDRSQCQNNPIAGAHALGMEEETGSPSENYDATENNGLIDDFQQVSY